MKLPLEGLLVVDFSQFLSGPSASLRLADLGARVVKIERPGVGDLCRKLVISNLVIDDESAVFQTINRNKESYTADLKDEKDKAKVIELIKKADVVLQNFRPGIIERIGLDYETVKKINPRVVYGTVSGYGKHGPWVKKPGQDLLVQSVSGLVHLNGNQADAPLPFGLAIADLITGSHLVQGILACLVRRGITNEGGHVEVSLLESTLDFQFEVLTTHLNDGGKLPQRSAINNAHAYLGAPYGIYSTQDGYIALAMGSVVKLGEYIQCEALTQYVDEDSWFDQRDEIKAILVDHLATQSTQHWLSKLEPHDFWCADVMTWDRLLQHEGFTDLEMVQTVQHPDGSPLQTTRCPITLDGQRLYSSKSAPRLGEDTAKIDQEYQL
ncbi:CaiB/BaiF CoA transferase family protein [Vibrio mediterranei]